MLSFINWVSPYYFIVLVSLASYFFILSLSNQYEMRRFTQKPEIFEGPFVSVLIPARNEERYIERCLSTLRNQLYKDYEILVLNDNSTDNTGSILERIAAEDTRVKVINGKELPDDWYGKPFAMQQLSEQAKGEILIFTDADTEHNPTSISWAVSNMQRLNADMISGYIGQKFVKLGEIITIPLMYFLTGFFIPLFLNRLTKFSFFSTAIGQYIVIRHEVFNAIGRCQAFRKKTSEDIHMSQYVKKKGYRTRFLNITEHVKCRMYEGYCKAIEGIGKNVFDFLGKSTITILLLALAVLVFLFLPLPILIICLKKGSPWIFHILFVNILYTLSWIFMFLSQRLNFLYAFLWPIMYLNLIYMAWWSWFRTVSGKGFFWKGRKVI